MKILLFIHQACFIILFRNAIAQFVLTQTTILKTGIEWELLFHMDERTFYRHLRVTHSQFVYLIEVLRQHGLKGYQHDGGVEIPLKQKVGLCPD